MTAKTVLALLGGPVLAAGLLGAAGPAGAADRPSLKTITKLPRTDHPDPYGNGPAGRGTVQLNAAVSQACNDGDPIAAPQWYFVGERTTGSLRVAATAAAFTFPLGMGRVPTGTAIVDHWTGEVLTCRTEAFSRRSRPVDVVAFLTAPFPGTEYGGEVRGDYTVFVDRIAASPPTNDRVENARVIAELPFRDDLDTSRADDDGPELVVVDPNEPSTFREQAGTAWYRWSPTQDGPAPRVSVTPTTAWDSGGGLHAAFFELLPAGGSRLLDGDDEDPASLEAGTDYLLGVGYAWNAYDSDVLATGGPISVAVTPR